MSLLSPPRCCWCWQRFRCPCSWCTSPSPTSTGGEKYLRRVATLRFMLHYRLFEALTAALSHCVSEDYGKTFQDVTHLINHTFIHTDFGIAISPDHSGKVRRRGGGESVFCFGGISEDSFQSSTLCWIQVMLTGDVSETGGFRLFRSRDFGLTFDPVDLPFEPLIQMLYNPGDCNIILTLSVMVPAFQL